MSASLFSFCRNNSSRSLRRPAFHCDSLFHSARCSRRSRRQTFRFKSSNSVNSEHRLEGWHYNRELIAMPEEEHWEDVHRWKDVHQAHRCVSPAPEECVKRGADFERTLTAPYWESFRKHQFVGTNLEANLKANLEKNLKANLRRFGKNLGKPFLFRKAPLRGDN